MNSKRSRSVLIVGIFAMASCGPGVVRENVGCGPGDHSLPILLVHGLTGNAGSWLSPGLVGSFEARGLLYGGTVADAPLPPADVYAFEASRAAKADLNHWAAELGESIGRVVDATGSSAVTIVAHSAGGVAARAYLVSRPDDHKVGSLITISSPHRGSPLAKLASLKTMIEDGVLPWPFSQWGTAWLGTLSDLERKWGVRFDDPVFEQLLPEEESPWLTALNGAPHPANVSYRFVRVEQESLSDLFTRLNPLWGGWGDVHNRALKISLMNRLSGLLQGSVLTHGDGVVPIERQAPGPLDSPGDARADRADTLILATSHSALIEDFDALLGIISGPVTFLEAYRWNFEGRGFLAVDYRHELGGASVVAARVADSSAEDLAVSEPLYCAGAGGRFSRVVIGPIASGDWRQVDVFVIPPDSQAVFAAGIVAGASDSYTLPQYQLGALSPPQVWVGEVASLSATNPFGAPWDAGIVGGAAARRPDLRVEMAVGDSYRVMSGLRRNVAGTIDMDWSEELEGDPLRDSLTLRVWDDDGGLLEDPTMNNDLVGLAGWGPGRWPRGPHTVALSPVGTLEMILHWEPRLAEIPRNAPMVAVRGRPSGLLNPYADRPEVR